MAYVAIDHGYVIAYVAKLTIGGTDVAPVLDGIAYVAM